jgi:hypothetical protein
MKKYFRNIKTFLPVAHCLLPIAYCQLLIAFSLIAKESNAQSTLPKKHKIAIFAPLYLDSAFDNRNEYRYTKNTMPGFINPGLEFYEGVQMALDSLALENAPLEVFVYDTRSAKETLEQQLKKQELQDVELIIAHCSNNELRILSNASLAKNVPVINANMPNDAGINNNPLFVILNPTLRTQCEGIYKFIQKNFSAKPIVIFRRKGRTDDIIRTLFDDFSKSTILVPLQLKYVELNDSFTVDQLKKELDSTKQNVCVAGSLDVNFGKRLAAQLSSIGQQYPISLAGMPTWESIRDFSKPEFKSIEIIYTSPFYNPRNDRISQSITEYFNAQLYARPGDMVFRGYEVTLRFVKLLLQFGDDLPSNLANKTHLVFTDYNIQPVINRSTTTLDYFENKKLYFLRWKDGIMSVN